eukprot:SAG31_NODE_5273_length_2639_cov_1.587795_2_plen_464_part_00
MRFLKSNDLRTWHPLRSSHPDPRWYSVNISSSGEVSRWDAAMMLRDDDAGGWLAYPTATVPGRIGCGLGLMRSADGISYTAVAPPVLDWGPLGAGTSLEIGGVAKIGKKYFAIGGTGNAGYNSYPHTGAANGYNVYTLSSDNATGPFRPQPESFRLSGSSTIPVKREIMHSLGAFVQDYDTGLPLVSNYMGSSNIFMTPFKEPVADTLGNLRLRWWAGNEALKGAAIPGFPPSLSALAGPHSTAIAWLPAPSMDVDGWNHTQGLVLTGQLTVAAAAGARTSSVGFAFEAVPPSQWTPDVPAPPANSTRQIMMSLEPVLDPLWQTVISDVVMPSSNLAHQQPNISVVDVSGAFPCGPGGVRCGDATKTSLSPTRTHSFILLARRGMFELYVDGWLVQYHVYGECAFTASGAQSNLTCNPANMSSNPRCAGCRECSGKIGLAVNGTRAEVEMLRGWQMSLSYFPQ